LRVNSEAETEPISPGPVEQSDQLKQEEGRTLRPRRQRRSVTSEADTTTATTSVTSDTSIKQEE